MGEIRGGHDGSAQVRPEHATTHAVAQATATLVAQTLLVMTFCVLTVGVDPLAQGGAAAAGGNLRRQVAFLALGAAAVPLILFNWRAAADLVPRTWSLLTVYAAMALSALWSAFPEVTLRRVAVFVILYLLALGIAATLQSARAVLVPLIVAAALVLIANWAVTIALPGRAFTDIGLAGLHPSKNFAGMVGQAMAVAFAAGLVALRTPAAFWSTAGLLVLTFAFLALTLSKTALGLSAIAAFCLVPFVALTQAMPRASLIAPVAFAIGVGGVLAISGLLGLTFADWATLVVGDATFTNRDDIWIAIDQHIAEAPWLGYGFGAQWSMLPLYHPLAPYVGFWNDSAIIRDINQSHHGYRDVLVHGGIVLAAAVALFVAHMAVGLCRAAARRPNDRWRAGLTALCAAYGVAFLLSNFLESTLFFPEGMLGQWMIVLWLAFLRVNRSPPRGAPMTLRESANV